MDVGRLGAPAGGPRTFLTNGTAFFFCRFMFAKEQAKLALNGFGRASRSAKDARAARLERVKC